MVVVDSAVPTGSVLRLSATALLQRAALEPALVPGDLVWSSFLASSALFDADAVAVVVVVVVAVAVAAAVAVTLA